MIMYNKLVTPGNERIITIIECNSFQLTSAIFSINECNLFQLMSAIHSN